MARVGSTLMAVVLLGLLWVQGAAAQSVLFDNGHGERFAIDKNGALQLSGLAQIVGEKGAKVAAVSEPLSDATLAGADGLVISGAFAPLKPEEVDAVIRFMQRGGKLAVMLHIAPPLVSLLDRLQITYTNGVIRENENVIDNDPQNFRATHLGKHAVLEGVKEFSLYGVWGLRSLDDSTRVIASTGSTAWIDLHGDKVQRPEETASFALVISGDVGKGGFLVFGDDAIFQNKFLDENNKKLAGNLANWLSGKQGGK